MREDHPIDELFRRSLDRAEADPPPAVWDRIRHARHRKRWRFWPGLNGLFLLLIPFAGTLVYFGLLGTGSPETHSTASIAAMELHSAPGASSDRQLDGPYTANEHLAEAAPIEKNELVSRSKQGIPLRSYHSDEGVLPHVGTNLNSDRNEPSFFNSEQNENEHFEGLDPSITSGTDDDEIVRSMPDLSLNIPLKNTGVPLIGETENTTEGTDYFSPLVIDLDRKLGPQFATRPEPPDYVLPKAEWVFSLLIGKFDVKRNWHGEDALLTQALNKSEGRTSTIAMGVGLGRHWRSGWGLSAGILTERSEQVFDHRERRTEVIEEVTNFMVTLDDQVFVNNVDTLLHYTTTEKEYRGLNRRSTLRIPIEGHFHKPIGRFIVGGRAGLSLEFTRAEQDLSLILDEQEGRLSVMQLPATELTRRHPMLLQGSIGVDLGYMFTEHWSVWAQPTYLSGSFPLSRTASTWNSPSRIGIQFRLSHHFIPRNRP